MLGRQGPIITSPNNPGMNLLPHPSIEASTGQVEIKCITSDQGEIKGFTTNQNDANP